MHLTVRGGESQIAPAAASQGNTLYKIRNAKKKQRYLRRDLVKHEIYIEKLIKRPMFQRVQARSAAPAAARAVLLHRESNPPA